MILSSGAQGISSLGGMILKMPIGKKNSALISSLEKVIEDTTSQQWFFNFFEEGTYK